MALTSKQIINELEKRKIKRYSQSDLRGGNQLMNRLQRIQNRDFNNKLKKQQDKILKYKDKKEALPKELKNTFLIERKIVNFRRNKRRLF